MTEPERDPPKAGPREIGLMAILLLAQLTVLVSLALRVGVTADEPGHLLSAYLYWQGKDELAPRDMPPAIKIVGGWVPALFGLPIPYDDIAVMSTHHEWEISNEMMARLSEQQIRRIFFFSRLPILGFSLLVTGLLWWWGRHLFSPRAGFLVAFLYTLAPTALAHGPLFKNDIASTFAYLLFWYRAWRFWRHPQLGEAAWLGASLLIALLCKMSLLVLVPLVPAVVISRYWTLRPFNLRRAIAALALALLIPYAGCLAACQFETKRLNANEIARFLRDKRSVPFIPMAWLFRVLPAPVPYWQGAISLLESDSEANPVYLMGKRYPRGHPLYFLTAIGLKSPIPIQILLVGGMALVGIAAVRRLLNPTHLFWLLPPLFYIGMASLSSLQLGVRLVLPALPFGLLICGVAVQRLLQGPRAALVGGILLWLIVADVRTYPHFISFFNQWVGGPENGIRYLSDSNIDWGQNLADLARFVQDNGIPKIRLSYFGKDNMYARLGARVEVIPPPWNDHLAQGPQLQPTSGYYAISATLLTGQFLPHKYVNYYSAFRELRPIARVGYSIYVYNIK